MTLPKLPASRYKEHNLKMKYGITPKDRAEILKFQEHKCALCGCYLSDKKCAIDHDHKTGRIRGIVCRRCNMFLIPLVETTNLFEKAVKYVKEGKVVLNGKELWFNPQGVPCFTSPDEEDAKILGSNLSGASIYSIKKRLDRNYDKEEL